MLSHDGVIAEIRHNLGYDCDCPRCGATTRLTDEMGEGIEEAGMGEFECDECDYREMVYADDVRKGYDILATDDRQVGLNEF